MERWITLINALSGKPLHCPESSVVFESYDGYVGSGCKVWLHGTEFLVCETEAEIMALLGIRE